MSTGTKLSMHVNLSCSVDHALTLFILKVGLSVKFSFKIKNSLFCFILETVIHKFIEHNYNRNISLLYVLQSCIIYNSIHVFG